jgi:hypothetical protein
MKKRDIKLVTIKELKIGDTVIHEGKERTVSSDSLKYDKFMGWSLFGDTYRLGYMLVKKVVG